MKKHVILAVVLVCASYLIFLKTRSFSPKPSQLVAGNISYAEQEKKGREEIKDPQTSQYQSIVIVENLGKKNDYGTGFVVGENKLLINRHIAESFDKDQKLSVRTVNAQGEVVNFKIKQVTHAPDDVDLSIIEVAPTLDGKNIHDGMKLLAFATQEEINAVKEGDAIHTVGYPTDNGFGTLWNSSGNVLTVGENVIIYDAYIYGGNSGSPLLNQDDKVIGLSNASADKPEGSQDTMTFGFLLTEKIYQFIQENV